MKRYEIWTTKSGMKIPVNEMDQQHLENTLKFLKRKEKELLDILEFGIPADISLYPIEDSIDKTLDEISKWIIVFKCELERRLKVNSNFHNDSLKSLNSVIQICSICGKVDAYKNDMHSCGDELIRQGVEEMSGFWD
jgi:hypothetical protein